VGTILYLIIIWPLAWRFGLAGAAAAFVAANAAMLVVLGAQLTRQYLKVRPR
jgi:O-antigen/teichoic acid export membrane protein